MITFTVDVVNVDYVYYLYPVWLPVYLPFVDSTLPVWFVVDSVVVDYDFSCVFVVVYALRLFVTAFIRFPVTFYAFVTRFLTVLIFRYGWIRVVATH